MPSTDAQPPQGRIAALRARYEPVLRQSDTAKAAGLAAAMIANNVIALVSTVVFAHELTDYSSLAALISYFLILSVAGQAIQVATAREGVLGHLGVGAGLIATLKRWTTTLAYVTVGLTVVSVLLRNPIAQAVGVKHDPWAAAIGIPAGCLWVEISILRGALQGVGDYKSVGLSLIGEQAVRLVVGAALAATALGVTGAYLGTPFSFIAVAIYCAVHLRRYAERAKDPALAAAAGTTPEHALELWTHFKRAWAPIAGLIVIAVLQNIDLIAAKHRFNGVPDLANSYAATAVAAKVLVWVAIGASFYLVPEVSRRRAGGEDTRPVLVKALGIILVCAVPVLLIFAFGAHQLLAAVFKPDQLKATNALLPLGIAFTVLACTYLAIQYMLALKRTWFLLLIGVVALAEPVLLLNASRRPANFAAVVLAVQAVGALIAFGLAWRRHGGPPPGGAPNVAQTSAAAGNGSSAGREELRDALGRGAEPAEVGGAAER
jgi:O-antigen/teichoic acid export membrane protein